MKLSQARGRRRGVIAIPVLVAALVLGPVLTLAGSSQSGKTVLFRPIGAASTTMLKADASVMEKRLSVLGTSSNAVVDHGSIKLTVFGAQHLIDDVSLAQASGALFFRPVMALAPSYSGPKGAAYKVPPTPARPFNYLSSGKYDASRGEYSPPAAGIDPLYLSFKTTSDDHSVAVARENVILPVESAGSMRYVLGPAAIDGQILDGTIISKAHALQDLQTRQWVVIFQMTKGGTRRFNAMAQRSYGQIEADDLSGTIISAPIIEATSFPSSGQISGNFTESSARHLAALLDAGPLPVPVQAVQ